MQLCLGGKYNLIRNWTLGGDYFCIKTKTAATQAQHQNSTGHKVQDQLQSCQTAVMRSALSLQHTILLLFHILKHLTNKWLRVFSIGYLCIFAAGFRDSLGSHGHLEREHIEGGNSGSRRVLWQYWKTLWFAWTRRNLADCKISP